MRLKCSCLFELLSCYMRSFIYFTADLLGVFNIFGGCCNSSPVSFTTTKRQCWQSNRAICLLSWVCKSLNSLDASVESKVFLASLALHSVDVLLHWWSSIYLFINIRLLGEEKSNIKNNPALWPSFFKFPLFFLDGILFHFPLLLIFGVANFHSTEPTLFI